MNRLFHYAIAGSFSILSPVESCPNPILSASQLARGEEAPSYDEANHYLLLPKEVEVVLVDTGEPIPDPIPPRKPNHVLRTMGVLYPPHRIKVPI